MKVWMWFPIIFIAGWIMGGWQPKTELLVAREELEVARLTLKSRTPQRRGFSGVTHMLGIPDPQTPDTPQGTSRPDDTDAPVFAKPDPVTPTTPSTTNTPSADRSMKQNIQNAMDVWETRSDIARATFVDNVALEEEQATRFDVLMTAMNIRLAHSIEQFTELVESGEPVDEEQTIKLVRDLSDSVASTYDELDGSMPPNWKQDAGDDFSVTAFIDPSVALPLADIEDQWKR